MIRYSTSPRAVAFTHPKSEGVRGISRLQLARSRGRDDSKHLQYTSAKGTCNQVSPAGWLNFSDIKRGGTHTSPEHSDSPELAVTEW